MQQYYYLNGNQQVGPFTVEQLGQQPLNGSTFVWAQGMTDWKRLADVPELSSLFPTASPAAVSAQPPLPGSQPVYSSMGYGVPPKNWLVESILVTVFCCLPFGIVGIINASKVESRFRMGDVQGAQEASSEAARWTKIGFFVALGLAAVYMLIFFLGLGSAIMGRNY